MSNEITKHFLRLMLVSGAPNKEARLANELGEIDSDFLARLGLAQILMRRERCPVPIEERNGEKSAPLLYEHKARATQEVMKGMLLPGEVGLTSDVHPKLGEQGKKMNCPLIKCPDSDELNTKSDRKARGAEFIAEKFEKYDDRELLVRVGAGVVAWVPRGIEGCITNKTYIVYSRNPLPDKQAAVDYLDFAAETHRAVNGESDNLELELSSRAAGFVLQEKLIEWALIRGLGVEIRGRISDPMAEINQLVDGFSVPMLKYMLEIVAANITKDHDPSVFKRTSVELLPNRRDRLEWGPANQVCSTYVGPYWNQAVYRA